MRTQQTTPARSLSQHNGKSTPWVRVTKKNPCPICGKPDWCLYSDDGRVVICARIQSEHPAGEAGWVHKTGADYPLPPISPSKPPEKQSEIASLEYRNEVYHALIAELALSPRHRQQLLDRGLTREQITWLDYRTLPLEDRYKAISGIKGKGLHMAGVPGFALEDGDVKLCGSPGILIPVRDLSRRIVAFQIRCDQTDTGKYKWLSSAGKCYGCSSGAPVHVAWPMEEPISGEVWITEGPLKADIAAMRLQCIVLAVPGVSNWRGALPMLAIMKPKKAIVAYDMDKLQNPTVTHYKDELINNLLSRRIRTFEADWDKSCKGIDDLLVTGEGICRK